MHQERPLLVSRRACSRTLKGIFHNLEWPPLYLRTMKIAYKHSLLNPPKQPCLVHDPALSCPHLLPVSPQTHSSSSTESWYIIPKPTLYRPQPTPPRLRNHGISSPNLISIAPKPTLHRLQDHPVSSTEPMVFRPRTHSAPPTSSSCIIH